MAATGFHGTSGEAARRILAGTFTVSRNAYDWLGDGVYFFQDAPLRAREWAGRRFGSDAAVVGAEIDLDGCLDLLDIRWQDFLTAAHQRFVEQLQRAGMVAPRQSTGAHRLDRHVLNYAVGILHEQGIRVRSVRAAFTEGEPLYPDSALFTRSHVQVAVRDLGALLSVWLEPGPEGGA